MKIASNFLKEFGLKFFFSKFQIFFLAQKIHKGWGFNIPERPPHTCTHMAHSCHFCFREFEKKLEFSKFFSKLWVCAFWVHILGVPVREHKLQHPTSNIFRSHQKRVGRSKVMQKRKLGLIWSNLVPIFSGVF